nr:FAD-dependent oxidoreductase [Spirochaetota bacterium]
MRKTYDVIIVGTGIAGLTSAIYLYEAGLNVAVFSKSDKFEDSNTNFAQGGIIAFKENDSAKSLEDDILKAGCYYNNKEAVTQLSEEGPKLVFDFLINKVGMEFNKNGDGSYDYTEEAAHSSRRILHYEDHTGDKIIESLLDYAKKLNISFYKSYTAVDLITNNHHSGDCQELYKPREVLGIYFLNNQEGKIETFFAHNVIIATGGVGNLYQYTTNPPSATGDGISMAYRAGADIINAEFVQFHPTCLFHKDIKRFLISESLRGEG